MSGNHVHKKYFKHYSARFIILLLAIILALVITGYIAQEMIVESEDRIDRVVLRYISRHLIHHRYNNLVKFITFFASVFFLVAASLAVFIFFITRKNWKRVIEFATISIGGFVLTTIMKYSFHRDRPLKPLITGANNFSFPSGHALSGFIFYGFLAYLAWKSGLPKKIKYLLSFFLIFFSFLIDLSRLYLRVHYPSDVISGVLIGFVWLLGVIWLIEKWEARGIKKSAA